MEEGKEDGHYKKGTRAWLRGKPVILQPVLLPKRWHSQVLIFGSPDLLAIDVQRFDDRAGRRRGWGTTARGEIWMWGMDEKPVKHGSGEKKDT